MGENYGDVIIEGYRKIKDLKVVQLKTELEQRGLNKYGSKKDLVQRLAIFEESKQKTKAAKNNPVTPNQWIEEDSNLANDFIREYFRSQKALLAEHNQHTPGESVIVKKDEKHLQKEKEQCTQQDKEQCPPQDNDYNQNTSKIQRVKLTIRTKSENKSNTPKMTKCILKPQILSCTLSEDVEKIEYNSSKTHRSKHKKSKKKKYKEKAEDCTNRKLKIKFSNFSDPIVEKSKKEVPITISESQLINEGPSILSRRKSKVNSDISSPVPYSKVSHKPINSPVPVKAIKIVPSTIVSKCQTSNEDSLVPPKRISRSRLNYAITSSGPLVKLKNKAIKNSATMETTKIVQPEIVPECQSRTGNSLLSKTKPKLNSIITSSVSKVKESSIDRFTAIGSVKTVEPLKICKSQNGIESSLLSRKKSKANPLVSSSIPSIKVKMSIDSSPIVDSHNIVQPMIASSCSSGKVKQLILSKRNSRLNSIITPSSINVNDTKSLATSSINFNDTKSLATLSNRMGLSPQNAEVSSSVDEENKMKRTTRSGREINSTFIKTKSRNKNNNISPVKKQLKRIQKPKKPKPILQGIYIPPKGRKSINKKPKVITVPERKSARTACKLNAQPTTDTKKHSVHSELFESLKRQIELPLHVEKFPLTEKNEVSSTSELTDHIHDPVNDIDSLSLHLPVYSEVTPINDSHVAVEGHLNDKDNVPDSVSETQERLLSGSTALGENILENSEVDEKLLPVETSEPTMPLIRCRRNSYLMKNILQDESLETSTPSPESSFSSHSNKALNYSVEENIDSDMYVEPVSAFEKANNVKQLVSRDISVNSIKENCKIAFSVVGDKNIDINVLQISDKSIGSHSHDTCEIKKNKNVQIKKINEKDKETNVSFEKDDNTCRQIQDCCQKLSQSVCDIKGDAKVPDEQVSEVKDDSEETVSFCKNMKYPKNQELIKEKSTNVTEGNSIVKKIESNSLKITTDLEHEGNIEPKFSNTKFTEPIYHLEKSPNNQINMCSKSTAKENVTNSSQEVIPKAVDKKQNKLSNVKTSSRTVSLVELAQEYNSLCGTIVRHTDLTTAKKSEDLTCKKISPTFESVDVAKISHTFVSVDMAKISGNKTSLSNSAEKAIEYETAFSSFVSNLSDNTLHISKTSEEIIEKQSEDDSSVDLGNAETGERFNTLSSEDSIENNADSKVDKAENSTINKVDNVENNTTDKEGSVENNTNYKVDSVDNTTTDKVYNVENNTTDKVNNVENNTTDKVDNLENITTDKLDNVEINSNKVYLNIEGMSAHSLKTDYLITHKTENINISTDCKNSVMIEKTGLNDISSINDYSQSTDKSLVKLDNVKNDVISNRDVNSNSQKSNPSVMSAIQTNTLSVDPETYKDNSSDNDNTSDLLGSSSIKSYEDNYAKETTYASCENTDRKKITAHSLTESDLDENENSSVKLLTNNDLITEACNMQVKPHDSTYIITEVSSSLIDKGTSCNEFTSDTIPTTGPYDTANKFPVDEDANNELKLAEQKLVEILSGKHDTKNEYIHVVNTDSVVSANMHNFNYESCEGGSLKSLTSMNEDNYAAQHLLSLNSESDKYETSIHGSNFSSSEFESNKLSCVVFNTDSHENDNSHSDQINELDECGQYFKGAATGVKHVEVAEKDSLTAVPISTSQHNISLGQQCKEQMPVVTEALSTEVASESRISQYYNTDSKDLFKKNSTLEDSGHLMEGRSDIVTKDASVIKHNENVLEKNVNINDTRNKTDEDEKNSLSDNKSLKDAENALSDKIAETGVDSIKKDNISTRLRSKSLEDVGNNKNKIVVEVEVHRSEYISDTEESICSITSTNTTVCEKKQTDSLNKVKNTFSNVYTSKAVSEEKQTDSLNKEKRICTKNISKSVYEEKKTDSLNMDCIQHVKLDTINLRQKNVTYSIRQSDKFTKLKSCIKTKKHSLQKKDLIVPDKCNMDKNLVTLPPNSSKITKYEKIPTYSLHENKFPKNVNEFNEIQSVSENITTDMDVIENKSSDVCYTNSILDIRKKNVTDNKCEICLVSVNQSVVTKSENSQEVIDIKLKENEHNVNDYTENSDANMDAENTISASKDSLNLSETTGCISKNSEDISLGSNLIEDHSKEQYSVNNRKDSEKSATEDVNSIEESVLENIENVNVLEISQNIVEVEKEKIASHLECQSTLNDQEYISMSNSPICNVMTLNSMKVSNSIYSDHVNVDMDNNKNISDLKNTISSSSDSKPSDISLNNEEVIKSVESTIVNTYEIPKNEYEYSKNNLADINIKKNISYANHTVKKESDSNSSITINKIEIIQSATDASVLTKVDNNEVPIQVSKDTSSHVDNKEEDSDLIKSIVTENLESTTLCSSVGEEIQSATELSVLTEVDDNEVPIQVSKDASSHVDNKVEDSDLIKSTVTEDLESTTLFSSVDKKEIIPYLHEQLPPKESVNVEMVAMDSEENPAEIKKNVFHSEVQNSQIELEDFNAEMTAVKDKEIIVYDSPEQLNIIKSEKTVGTNLDIFVDANREANNSISENIFISPQSSTIKVTENVTIISENLDKEEAVSPEQDLGSAQKIISDMDKEKAIHILPVSSTINETVKVVTEKLDKEETVYISPEQSNTTESKNVVVSENSKTDDVYIGEYAPSKEETVYISPELSDMAETKNVDAVSENTKASIVNIGEIETCKEETVYNSLEKSNIVETKNVEVISENTKTSIVNIGETEICKEETVYISLEKSIIAETKNVDVVSKNSKNSLVDIGGNVNSTEETVYFSPEQSIAEAKYFNVFSENTETSAVDIGNIVSSKEGTVSSPEQSNIVETKNVEVLLETSVDVHIGDNATSSDIQNVIVTDIHKNAETISSPTEQSILNNSKNVLVVSGISDNSADFNIKGNVCYSEDQTAIQSLLNSENNNSDHRKAKEIVHNLSDSLINKESLNSNMVCITPDSINLDKEKIDSLRNYTNFKQLGSTNIKESHEIKKETVSNLIEHSPEKEIESTEVTTADKQQISTDIDLWKNDFSLDKHTDRRQVICTNSDDFINVSHLKEETVGKKSNSETDSDVSKNELIPNSTNKCNIQKIETNKMLSENADGALVKLNNITKLENFSAVQDIVMTENIACEYKEAEIKENNGDTEKKICIIKELSSSQKSKIANMARSFTEYTVDVALATDFSVLEDKFDNIEKNVEKSIPDDEERTFSKLNEKCIKAFGKSEEVCVDSQERITSHGEKDEIISNSPEQCTLKEACTESISKNKNTSVDINISENVSSSEDIASIKGEITVEDCGKFSACSSTGNVTATVKESISTTSQEHSATNDSNNSESISVYENIKENISNLDVKDQSMESLISVVSNKDQNNLKVGNLCATEDAELTEANSPNTDKIQNVSVFYNIEDSHANIHKEISEKHCSDEENICETVKNDNITKSDFTCDGKVKNLYQNLKESFITHDEIGTTNCAIESGLDNSFQKENIKFDAEQILTKSINSNNAVNVDDSTAQLNLLTSKPTPCIEVNVNSTPTELKVSKEHSEDTCSSSTSFSNGENNFESLQKISVGNEVVFQEEINIRQASNVNSEDHLKVTQYLHSVDTAKSVTHTVSVNTKLSDYSKTSVEPMSLEEREFNLCVKNAITEHNAGKEKDIQNISNVSKVSTSNSNSKKSFTESLDIKSVEYICNESHPDKTAAIIIDTVETASDQCLEKKFIEQHTGENIAHKLTVSMCLENMPNVHSISLKTDEKENSSSSIKDNVSISSTQPNEFKQDSLEMSKSLNELSVAGNLGESEMSKLISKKSAAVCSDEIKAISQESETVTSNKSKALKIYEKISYDSAGEIINKFESFSKHSATENSDEYELLKISKAVSQDHTRVDSDENEPLKTSNLISQHSAAKKADNIDLILSKNISKEIPVSTPILNYLETHVVEVEEHIPNSETVMQLSNSPDNLKGNDAIEAKNSNALLHHSDSEVSIKEYNKKIVVDDACAQTYCAKNNSSLDNSKELKKDVSDSKSSIEHSSQNSSKIAGIIKSKDISDKPINPRDSANIDSLVDTQYLHNDEEFKLLSEEGSSNQQMKSMSIMENTLLASIGQPQKYISLISEKSISNHENSIPAYKEEKITNPAKNTVSHDNSLPKQNIIDQNDEVSTLSINQETSEHSDQTYIRNCQGNHKFDSEGKSYNPANVEGIGQVSIFETMENENTFPIDLCIKDKIDKALKKVRRSFEENDSFHTSENYQISQRTDYIGKNKVACKSQNVLECKSSPLFPEKNVSRNPLTERKSPVKFSICELLKKDKPNITHEKKGHFIPLEIYNIPLPKSYTCSSTEKCATKLDSSQNLSEVTNNNLLERNTNLLKISQFSIENLNSDHESVSLQTSKSSVDRSNQKSDTIHQSAKSFGDSSTKFSLNISQNSKDLFDGHLLNKKIDLTKDDDIKISEIKDESKIISEEVNDKLKTLEEESYSKYSDDCSFTEYKTTATILGLNLSDSNANVKSISMPDSESSQYLPVMSSDKLVHDNSIDKDVNNESFTHKSSIPSIPDCTNVKIIDKEQSTKYNVDITEDYIDDPSVNKRALYGSSVNLQSSIVNIESVYETSHSVHEESINLYEKSHRTIDSVPVVTSSTNFFNKDFTSPLFSQAPYSITKDITDFECSNKYYGSACGEIMGRVRQSEMTEESEKTSKKSSKHSRNENEEEKSKKTKQEENGNEGNAHKSGETEDKSKKSKDDESKRKDSRKKKSRHRSNSPDDERRSKRRKEKKSKEEKSVTEDHSEKNSNDIKKSATDVLETPKVNNKDENKDSVAENADDQEKMIKSSREIKSVKKPIEKGMQDGENSETKEDNVDNTIDTIEITLTADSTALLDDDLSMACDHIPAKNDSSVKESSISKKEHKQKNEENLHKKDEVRKQKKDEDKKRDRKDEDRKRDRKDEDKKRDRKDEDKKRDRKDEDRKRDRKDDDKKDEDRKRDRKDDDKKDEDRKRDRKDDKNDEDRKRDRKDDDKRQKKDEEKKQRRDDDKKYKRDEERKRSKSKEMNASKDEEKSDKDEVSKQKEKSKKPVEPFKSVRKVTLTRSKSRESPKKKWASKSKSSMEISSNSLKILVPDVKPLSPSELHLDEDTDDEDDDDKTNDYNNKENSLNSSKDSQVHKKEKRRTIEWDDEPKKKREKEAHSSRSVHVETAPAIKGKLFIAPSKNKLSRVVSVGNLTRPYTTKQLLDLLKRTGNIVENGFWINDIKSKCLAMYDTEDQALETRIALHGVRWPSLNPKELFVDFSTESDFEKKLKESTNLSHILNDEQRLIDRKRAAAPIREWDLAKMEEKVTGEKDRRRRERETEREEKEKRRDREQERERDRSPRRQRHREDEQNSKKNVELKSLDDLFNKTAAQPSIYWIPLNAEQIIEKEGMRRARMAESDRREAEMKAAAEQQRQEREKERQEREKERERQRRRNRERRRTRSRSRSSKSPRRSPRRSRRSNSPKRSKRRSRTRSRS